MNFLIRLRRRVFNSLILKLAFFLAEKSADTCVDPNEQIEELKKATQFNPRIPQFRFIRVRYNQQVILVLVEFFFSMEGKVSCLMKNLSGVMQSSEELVRQRHDVRAFAGPGSHGQQRDRRTSRNPSKHRPETAALAGTEGLDPQTGPGNQSALRSVM
jgi:hypothetical protein